MFRRALGRNGRPLCVRTRGGAPPPRYRETPYRTNYRQLSHEDEYADDDEYDYETSDYDQGEHDYVEDEETETYEDYEEDEMVEEATEDEDIEVEPEVSPQCLPLMREPHNK
jgi:hypothetical protein